MRETGLPRHRFLIVAALDGPVAGGLPLIRFAALALGRPAGDWPVEGGDD